MSLKTAIMKNVGISVSVATLAFATTAFAGGEPPVDFNFEVNGEFVDIMAPPGDPIGDPEDGLFNFEDSFVGDGYLLEYDLNVKTDPFVAGNIVITNQSAMTQTFAFTVTLNNVGIDDGSLIGGSVSGGLTADGDGGTLASLPNDSVWSALIDGSPTQQFFGPGFSMSANPFQSVDIGPQSFGTPIPSETGPNSIDSIGIRIAFSLTPGDQASFTSAFVAEVPAPAGLAMFAVGGLFGVRRRRAA